MRLLHVRQADGFDELYDPDQSRPHVRRQFRQFGVDRLVQGLNGPRQSKTIIPDVVLATGMRERQRESGRSSHSVDLAQPSLKLVPTGEIQGHHLTASIRSRLRWDHRAISLRAVPACPCRGESQRKAETARARVTLPSAPQPHTYQVQTGWGRQVNHSHSTVRFAVPGRRKASGRWPRCKSLVDTLSRLLYTRRHGDRQLSTRWIAGDLRDGQESEGAAGPAQTLQKGAGRASCCDGALRPEHARLECAPLEGQSRGPARGGRQWPMAHHVPLGRQRRSRAGSRAVSLNGRRRRWRRRRGKRCSLFDTR